MTDIMIRKSRSTRHPYNYIYDVYINNKWVLTRTSADNILTWLRDYTSVDSNIQISIEEIPFSAGKNFDILYKACLEAYNFWTENSDLSVARCFTNYLIVMGIVDDTDQIDSVLLRYNILHILANIPETADKEQTATILAINLYALGYKIAI